VLALREVAELLRCFGQVIDVDRHLLRGSRSVAGPSMVAIERSVALHCRSQSLGRQARVLIAHCDHAGAVPKPFGPEGARPRAAQ
jgi:hypothetical protein